MRFTKVVFAVGVCILLLAFGTGAVAQPKKLTLWLHSAFSPESATLGEMDKVFKDLFEEFEKENNVKIYFEVAGGVDEIRQKTFAAAKVHEYPDVAMINTTWIPALLALGWIYPIDQFVTEEYLADYVPASLTQCQWEGKLYSLEWYMAARAFFYRNDWLEEVGAELPETWIDLYTTGQKLTRPGRWAIGYAGKVHDATPLQLLCHFWGFDGVIVGPNARPMLDEPGNREALERVYHHWADMVNKYKIAPKDIANWMDSEITTAFLADQIGMMFNSSSRVRDIVDARPDLEEVMGAGLVPMPKGYHGAVDVGSWGWILTTPDPERQKLAWKLIEKAQEPEWMARIDTEHWGVPTRYSAQKLALASGKIRPLTLWKDLFEAFKIGGHTRPVIPYHRTLFDNLSLGAQEVILQKITPEEAVNRIQEECMKKWQQLQK